MPIIILHLVEECFNFKFFYSSRIHIVQFLMNFDNHIISQVQAVLLLLGGCELDPGTLDVDMAYHRQRVFSYLYIEFCSSNVLVCLLKHLIDWRLYYICTRLQIQRGKNLWLGFVKRGKRGALRRKLDTMSGKKLHSSIAFLHLPFIIIIIQKLWHSIHDDISQQKWEHTSNAWIKYVVYTCQC